MAIDSRNFFRSHCAVWKILGLTHDQVTWKKLYISVTIVFHLLITIGYPLHLGMSVFRNGNLTDDIKSVTFIATYGACSLKFIIYAYNFDKLRRMKELLMLLDLRVKRPLEMDIYNTLRSQIRAILYMFTGLWVTCAMSAELAFILQDGCELMYPAWFPFDWRNSSRNFYLANLYQIFGSCYQLMQNYVNDCFPIIMLCIISAHIKMLYIRFEQIGVDESEDVVLESQLEACITDHKRLLELFQTMESFMSLPILIQIVVSALNVCVSIAGVLFFVTEPMSRTYLVFYAIAMPIQIFPTCYYGTDNELWFGKLHYAVFSCNWIKQSRNFKKKLMLFVECSLKQKTAMAGGMVRIHVDTFFSTLKFAYSLFTIILRMRK
ncbi:odorant receptor 59a-like [Drosophila innubila]|uniref:odorant receptor 59a-like n=1 Tax=Drosophila innubila TaxID=198719 RepID=UPI00148D38DC|nr:odorant receptor 59a-like [Drosophila innubila]